MQHAEPLEARQFLSVQTESDLPSALTTTAADAQEIVYSPPIMINSGGVYSGNWESLDADIPAVSIWTSEPVIIINSTVFSAFCWSSIPPSRRVCHGGQAPSRSTEHRERGGEAASRMTTLR